MNMTQGAGVGKVLGNHNFHSMCGSTATGITARNLQVAFKDRTLQEMQDNKMSHSSRGKDIHMNTLAAPKTTTAASLRNYANIRHG